MPDARQIVPASIGNSDELGAAPWLEVLEHAFEGVALVEPDSWKIVYANPTLLRWLETTPGSEPIWTITDVLSTDDSQPLADQIESAWQRNEFEGTLRVQLTTNGGIGGPLTLRFCRLQLPSGPILALWMRTEDNDAAAANDTTRQHRDSLTGLPDRSFLLSKLASLLSGERLGDRQFAVLFVDLDNFKQVNDAHGHLVGDRVLNVVARRLSECVRDEDYVVRYGGDEFVLLLEHVTNSSEIEPVISRVHSVLAEPISLPEGDFTLSASVGAALATPGHHTPDEILAAADRAMYAAKRANA